MKPKVYPLRELFHIARGGSPRPIDSHLTDNLEGMPWIMIGDVAPDSKYIESTKKRILQSSTGMSRVISPGAFLLTNSMSFGRPYISRITGCIHDGWLVLERKTDQVNEDFFYYLIGSPFVFAQFERLAAGATVKNLNIDLVSRVEVPLPSLNDQVRIAKVMDKCEEMRIKYMNAAILTRNLQTSILGTFLSEVPLGQG